MCDLPNRYYLKIDIVKVVTILNNGASKLCSECLQTLREELMLSNCIFDIRECNLCNNEYCKVHLSDHIDRRVCQQ
jgi:hypothetical protein